LRSLSATPEFTFLQKSQKPSRGSG
jgi:hypothetical protein